MSPEEKWQVERVEPVIRPGQLNPPWDNRRAGAAHVLKIGGRYRLYYWGTDPEGFHWICTAEADSVAPIVWRGTGPILGPQRDSEYNAVGPSMPFVLPLNEREWLLFFCAWGRQNKRLPNSTGGAISEDGGRRWRYLAEKPLLAFDRPWDQEATGSVCALHEQGRIRLYYTAIAGYFPKPEGVRTGHGDMIPRISIAYAESIDGVHWSKPHDEPVVQPRGHGVEPYEYVCSKPFILPRASGKGYWLWVNTFGTAYRVHRLESSDGLHWTWLPRRGPEGELGIGPSGAFDDIQRSYPCFLQEANEWRCWFTGNGFGTQGMGYAWKPAEP